MGSTVSEWGCCDDDNLPWREGNGFSTLPTGPWTALAEVCVEKKTEFLSNTTECTDRIIAFDADIQGGSGWGIHGDIGWNIQDNWIPMEHSEPDFVPGSSLRSMYPGSIASKTPHKITLHSGIQGNHAGGDDSVKKVVTPKIR